MGAQKNPLMETVLLSTHNICFGREIKNKFFLLHTLTLGPENVKQLSAAEQMTLVGAIRTAAADSVEFCGIRPQMYIEDLL